MKKTIKKILFGSLFLAMSLAVVGCTNDNAKEEAKTENNTIRLGVMSAADSAPIPVSYTHLRAHETDS